MDFEYTYRLTGPHSITRIKPLLPHSCKWREIVDISSEKPSQIADFVWETYCEKSYKSLHDNALILNRLHNFSIIEDKSNMAFLQLQMNVPVLQTFIAKSADDVKHWCETRWGSHSQISGGCSSGVSGSDWWAVKASKGNGGKDIFVSWNMHHTEYKYRTNSLYTFIHRLSTHSTIFKYYKIFLPLVKMSGLYRGILNRLPYITIKSSTSDVMH